MRVVAGLNVGTFGGWKPSTVNEEQVNGSNVPNLQSQMQRCIAFQVSLEA